MGIQFEATISFIWIVWIKVFMIEQIGEYIAIQYLWYFRHDLNDHVDTLQYDLDGLRDVLSSNQYSIDPSFLLGVSAKLC